MLAVLQYTIRKLIGPWEIWLQSQISKFQTRFNDKYKVFSVKLLSGKYHNTSLIISQHWFR